MHLYLHITKGFIWQGFRMECEILWNVSRTDTLTPDPMLFEASYMDKRNSLNWQIERIHIFLRHFVIVFHGRLLLMQFSTSRPLFTSIK